MLGVDRVAAPVEESVIALPLFLTHPEAPEQRLCAALQLAVDTGHERLLGDLELHGRARWSPIRVVNPGHVTQVLRACIKSLRQPLTPLLG